MHLTKKSGSKQGNQRYIFLLYPPSIISPNRLEMWTGKGVTKNNEKKL